MSDSEKLTLREREYLDCQVPLLSASSAVMRIIGGIFASLGGALLSPGYSKADSKLIRTAREIRYTKYKKAVLRKLEDQPKKGDEKLLKKLNKKDFVLAFETYDADKFTEELYREYMEKRKHSTENR